MRTHVQLGRNRRVIHPRPVSVVPPRIQRDALWFQSLRGMGDNVFQRPYVYEYCKSYDRVYIDTPWPHLYADMPDNLIFLRNQTKLRTQMKNMELYCSGYPQFPDEDFDSIRSGYGRSKTQNVYQILSSRFAKQVNFFHMDPPSEWKKSTAEALEPHGISVDEPFLLVRNTTKRREWSAPERNCRNEYLQRASADFKRKTKCKVVEVADLEPPKEILDGEPIQVADARLVEGELVNPALIWAFANAAAVISCHGFALPLAQMVKANALIIFGGYEGPERFMHKTIDAQRVQCLTPHNITNKRIRPKALKNSVSLLIDNM